MLISIIVPVYNKIHYINFTLSAILSQSFRDFECILIDDGSTDGSGQVCDEFAELDKRFIVFHIPNGGVSHARNIGLDNAHGEYITFIDADDKVHPDYLANIYSCAAASGVDLVIGCIEKVWADSNIRQPAAMPYHGIVYQSELLLNFVEIQKMTGIYGCCGAKLFSRRLSDEIRFDETLHLAEDLDYYLKLFPRVKKLYFDDKPYYYYLQEAENSSSLVSSEEIDYVAQLIINVRFRDFLKQMGCYTGKNQKIIEEVINNYLYFSIFYCPNDQFLKRFTQLYDICEQNNIIPCGKKILQKILLLCLRTRLSFMAKLIMNLYRFAKKLIY